MVCNMRNLKASLVDRAVAAVEVFNEIERLLAVAKASGMPDDCNDLLVWMVKNEVEAPEAIAAAARVAMLEWLEHDGLLH
jgi:hypothetical protein